jgi:coenzyme F420-0:L-glutamate ligase/coenzyme F420-1:gamma-L-glutamate ligase
MGRGDLLLRPVRGIPPVTAGNDLAALMLAALEAESESLADGDVLVLAQKIVSKAEGRTVRLDDVTPSPRALELAAETGKDPRVVELILRESTEIVRQRPGLLIVVHRLGIVLANAGIDASNVGGSGQVLLLPVDPDASAARIRETLRARTGAEVAVLVIDSIGRAWRRGTIGTAIGVSGMPALLDLRGRPDLDGRLLESTEVGIADELAAAASLLMGQAQEGLPAVLVRGFHVAGPAGRAPDLLRPKESDLFR